MKPRRISCKHSENHRNPLELTQKCYNMLVKEQYLKTSALGGHAQAPNNAVNLTAL